MWNINASQKRILCAIFTKFAEFVPHFMMLKFGWICSRGCGVMGVLSRGVLVSPKFSVPPSGETMRQTAKSFAGARTCSRSSITMPTFGGARISPAAGVAKNVEFFVCLSVCLSVRHAFERQRLCARRRWSTETILMPLDRGRFVVVHPCSALSDRCQLATTLNAEIQKRQKLGIRINRSRRPLACKRTPWVRYSTPNLILIGERLSVQEPQKSQNLPKNYVFWPPEADTMNTFR